MDKMKIPIQALKSLKLIITQPLLSAVAISAVLMVKIALKLEELRTEQETKKCTHTTEP